MRLALLFIGSVISGSVVGQHCLTMEKSTERASKSAKYQEGLAGFEQVYHDFEQAPSSITRADAKPIDIPLVVHVLYESEQYNIPDSQIHSQVAALNRDFNWEQDDKHKIPELWRNLGAPTGFQFHLADKDPDGNFTKGITRTQTDVENIGDSEDYWKTSRGGADPWNQAHYVNIWVCVIGDNVLGYTYLPSTSAEPSDGIVIDPRAFGSGGVAQKPYTMGRTLVHEMGHYFGLRHPWGNVNEEDYGCTNTDHMSDTPWQYEPNFGCAEFPSVSCSSEPNGDMFVNFMDYSNDTCSLLFTKLQVEFMQLVLFTSKVTLIHSKAVTGVNVLQDETQLRIYPNPSQGLFQVSFSGNEQTYYVCDVMGKKVTQGFIQPGHSELDLTQMEKGVYLLITQEQVHRLVMN